MMAEPTIRVANLRAGFDDPHDQTFGCGQPPADYQPDQLFKTGTVCAGAGTQPSCGLCPHSPSYHRRPDAEPIAAGTTPPPDVWIVPEHSGLLDWSKDAGLARGVEHWDYRQARPCRYCGASVQTRDAAGLPSCKVCAEANGQTNADVIGIYRRSGEK